MLVLVSEQLIFPGHNTEPPCEPGKHIWPVEFYGDHARYVKCSQCDVYGYFSTPEKLKNARENMRMQEGTFDWSGDNLNMR